MTMGGTHEITAWCEGRCCIIATDMCIGEIYALEQIDIYYDGKYIDITKTVGRRKNKFTEAVSLKAGPPKTRYSVRRIPLLPGYIG